MKSLLDNIHSGFTKIANYDNGIDCGKLANSVVVKGVHDQKCATLLEKLASRHPSIICKTATTTGPYTAAAAAAGSKVWAGTKKAWAGVSAAGKKIGPEVAAVGQGALKAAGAVGSVIGGTALVATSFGVGSAHGKKEQRDREVKDAILTDMQKQMDKRKYSRISKTGASLKGTALVGLGLGAGAYLWGRARGRMAERRKLETSRQEAYLNKRIMANNPDDINRTFKQKQSDIIKERYEL